MCWQDLTVGSPACKNSLHHFPDSFWNGSDGCHDIFPRSGLVDLEDPVLDGLHQLTRYDHSAALWIWNPSLSALRRPPIDFESLSDAIAAQSWP